MMAEIKPEETLTPHRQHLTDLFMNAPLSICAMKGPGHTFQMANSLYYKLTKKKDIAGKTVKQVFPEMEYQGFLQILDNVYTSGKPYKDIEASMKIRRDGDENLSEIYLDFIYQPYFDKDGKVEGIYYFGVDVTEKVNARKIIEENLSFIQSASAQQSSILNALPANIALLDEHGVITEVNEAWKQFAEANKLVAANYDIGKNYITASQNATGDDEVAGKAMAAGIADVLAGRVNRYTLEYPCHSQVERRWFQAKVSPTENGKDKGAVIMHINITERVLAEERTKHSEANLLAIIENTDANIYSVDTDLRYLTFNSVLEKSIKLYYGHEIQRGECVTDIIEKINPAEAAEWRAIYTEALTGKTMQFEKEINIGDFRSFTSFSIHPIWKDNRVMGLSCYVRDITPQKLAELEILSLNASLEAKVKERTNELEETNMELESFSYTVSHDLQAPLRIVNGFSKILLEEFSNKIDETGKEYLTIISHSAERMSQLIKDLLAFAQLGKSSITKLEVDMNQMVKTTIDEAKMNMPNPSVYIKLSHLASAYGDANLLKQVWSNLIFNALKYSAKKEHPVIEIGMQIIDSTRTYYIKDNGVGFDMKYAGKLFEVFKRLHSDEEFEGTGIGLALVYRILTRHGGKIWVDAKVEEGATFYFTLPDS